MADNRNTLKSGSMKTGYDPVRRAEEVARMVCEGDRRKYHRFRPARFCGGIATADCVGCPLSCLFCWSWHQVVRPRSHGRFYSPRDVAANLVGIARKKRFRQVRISGNEPTLGREHLLKVLERIPQDIVFILETNGLLLGDDRTYAEDLARFKNFHVRISLKGTNEEEFSALTGAHPNGFTLQIKGMENLSLAGVWVSHTLEMQYVRESRRGAAYPRKPSIQVRRIINKTKNGNRSKTTEDPPTP